MMTLTAWLDSERKHTTHSHTHTCWPLNDTLPQTAIMVKCDLWFDIEPVEEKNCLVSMVTLQEAGRPFDRAQVQRT